jgi:hypothetical protein
MWFNLSGWLGFAIKNIPEVPEGYDALSIGFVKAQIKLDLIALLPSKLTGSKVEPEAL